MEHLSEEEKRQEQLDFLKSQKTCSNCVHKQMCTIVNSIMALPVNKFVVTLKQVPFYEGINKSVGENCFHFQNENSLYTTDQIKEKLLNMHPQIEDTSEFTNPFLYQHIEEWYNELNK